MLYYTDSGAQDQRLYMFLTREKDDGSRRLSDGAPRRRLDESLRLRTVLFSLVAGRC